MSPDPPGKAAPSGDRAAVARAPAIVTWETTRACDLACLDCRADAQWLRDLEELSTLEAMALINRVRCFGRPRFVLTGGDPMKRPDAVDLVRHAARIGLPVTMATSSTPLVTDDALGRLSDAGLERLALGLDGSTPGRHDRHRGVPGSYRRTLAILRTAVAGGLPVQIHTRLSRYNLDDVEEIFALLEGLGVALWTVRFPVPSGRGRSGVAADPRAFEAVLHRIYEVSRGASFPIECRGAPHYRRVLLQRRGEERGRAPGEAPGGRTPDGTAGSGGRSAGQGAVFVGHTGEVRPSRRLPLSAGNVRSDDLVELYREHELFRVLRDPGRLAGRCGACEYRRVCGGSRARAFALTGDPLEADPACAHRPGDDRISVEGTSRRGSGASPRR